MKTKNPNKITKDSNLAQVVYEHPEAVEILLDYGLHCIGCMASHYDSIGMGAKIHGLSDKEIDEMIEKINKAILSGK